MRKLRLSLRFLVLGLVCCTLSVHVSSSKAVSIRVRNIGTQQGLPNSVVKCFAQDDKGYVWMGTFNGLARFDGTRFMVYRHSDSDSTSLADGHIEALNVLPDGRLFVGTASGLDCLDTKSGRIAHCRYVDASGQEQTVSDFISMIKVCDGFLYVSSTEGHLWNMSLTDTVFHECTSLSEKKVLDVRPYQRGQMFVLTADALRIVDTQTYKTLSSIAVSGLADDWNTLYYSHNLQTLIVGSGIGRSSQTFMVDSHGQLQRSSLQVPPNLKATLDYRGATYFATDGEGIIVYRPTTTVPSSSSAIVPAAVPGAPAPSLHPVRGAWSTITPTNSALPSFAIHALFADREDNLWIGTYREGMSLASPAFDLFQHYNRSDGWLNQDVVTAVYKDGPLIYAGVDGGGLNIIDTQTGTTRALTAENSGLTGNNIFNMEVLGTDLWINVFDHAPCRYSLTTHNIIVGGPVPVTWSQGDTLTDRHGNWWYGTERGLCFHPQGGSSSFLICSYLLPSTTQFCPQSCHADSSGHFLFGSTTGLYEFHPDSVLAHIHTAPIYFDELSVLKGNRHIPLYGQTGGTVTLHHDENFFSISFSSPLFANPYRPHYRYRLSGIDADWREADDIREVSYTTVPHGTYTFSIQSCLPNGRWPVTASSLQLRILPPWYLTWWAKLLWLLAALATVCLPLRYYIHFQRMRLALHQKEQEKEWEHRMNEEKINFFAGITHELRTPMFLITAPLEELLNSHKRPVPVPFSYIQSMYRNALRLNRLVDNILDFRKIQNDPFQMQAIRQDAVQLCKRLAPEYAALCQQKDISFHFQTPMQSCMTEIDVPKFELILSNLITNAYKYTPSGGQVTLQLQVTPSPCPAVQPSSTNHSLVILVSDTGIGIKPDEIRNIFKPYYRSAQPNKHTTGNGLGLALVQQLVQAHKGTIRVKSQPGQGTTFTITLPLTTPQPLAPSSAIATTPALTPQPSTLNLQPSGLNPYTILIVDDEPEIITLLKQHLSENYNIIIATNGLEGLDMAANHLPDLIICDVIMPQMDGYQFLAQLKADRMLQHIPFIMLSARQTDADRIMALNQGADAYLTKPISLRVLTAHIQRLLANDDTPLTATDSVIAVGTIPKVSSPSPRPQSKAQMSKEDKKFLLRCKKIIDQNLNNGELSVEHIARQMNVSHSTLYKRIKAITGRSVIEIIVDYRIFHAIDLFRKGETNITSVAERCGFNDIRAFRAAFKNRTGRAPKDFILHM